VVAPACGEGPPHCFFGVRTARSASDPRGKPEDKGLNVPNPAFVCPATPFVTPTTSRLQQTRPRRQEADIPTGCLGWIADIYRVSMTDTEAETTTMRRLIQQPPSVAADSISTAVAVWKILAIPMAFFAVGSTFYATNKLELLLIFGGFYAISGVLGALCCWLKSVPSWLIYWFRTRN
jgi:hypothetical protein